MLALASLAALLAAAPASAKAGDLHAFRYGAHGNVLTPYDPLRLTPTGPGIRLGRFGHAWSVSLDRSRLAAAVGVRRAGEPTSIRLVDLVAGAVEGTVTLAGEHRRVAATAWIRGRVLVVVAGRQSATVYSVDPDARAVTGRVEIPGTLVSGERARLGLALLLAPAEGIGPATVAVVDRRPHARAVTLERITAGTTRSGEGAARRLTVRRPGIATSPSGERLYVFGGGEPAARVDLRTLAVRYAPARRTAAVRKAATGSVREAASLPDGRVVVWGADYDRSTPVGVALVDPKDWSARVLAPAGSFVRVDGGLIFLRGRNGVGLRYLLPGGRAVELLRAGSVASVRVVGTRALVTFLGRTSRAAVVDLRTGRLVRHTVPAHLVLDLGQPISG